MIKHTEERLFGPSRVDSDAESGFLVCIISGLMGPLFCTQETPRFHRIVRARGESRGGEKSPPGAGPSLEIGISGDRGLGGRRPERMHTADPDFSSEIWPEGGNTERQHRLLAPNLEGEFQWEDG